MTTLNSVPHKLLFTKFSLNPTHQLFSYQALYGGALYSSALYNSALSPCGCPPRRSPSPPPADVKRPVAYVLMKDEEPPQHVI